MLVLAGVSDPGQRRHAAEGRRGGRGRRSTVLRRCRRPVCTKVRAGVGWFDLACTSDERSPISARAGGDRRPRRATPRPPARVGASPTTATDLTGPVAVVLGSEAHGVAADARPAARRLDAHPDGGRRRVAQRRASTGAVVCFEAARQRRAIGRVDDVTRRSTRCPTPIVHLDADRCIVDANEAAGRLVGRTLRRAASGPPRRSTLSPRGRDGEAAARGRLASVGQPAVGDGDPRARSHDRHERRRPERSRDRAGTNATATARYGAVLVAPSVAPPGRRRADGQRGGVDGEPRAAQPAHVGEGLHVAAAQPVGPAHGRPEEDDARAGAPRRRPRHAAHHRAARHQPARDGPARPAPPDASTSRELAAHVVEKLTIAYPDLDCTITFADGFPRVFADPDKVEQVLTNLVENAAKYAQHTRHAASSATVARGRSRGRGERHRRRDPGRRRAEAVQEVLPARRGQADRHRARPVDQPRPRRGPRRPSARRVRAGTGERVHASRSRSSTSTSCWPTDRTTTELPVVAARRQG